MSVVLGTLVLNELEWLEKLYAQHKDWYQLTRWVFVEAADRVYADVNPGMVTRAGLSVDGTSAFLRDLANCDPRVVYIPHGFSQHRDPEKGKCAARQRYLDVAEEVRPNYVIVCDADEFYTRRDQWRLWKVMNEHPDYDAFTFVRREIWRPPSLAEQPLFTHEVVGGFWSIPCCHWWRWKPGMNYRDCHNTPSADGKPLLDKLLRLHENPQANHPQMVHLGFASVPRTRLAKNNYYAHRGEARDHKRRWYVESRAAWEKWQPGDALPSRGSRADAHVIPYTGPVPEVFRA